jgi:hypothetical protein
MYLAKMVITSAALSMRAFSAGAVSIAPTNAMANVGHTATVSVWSQLPIMRSVRGLIRHF